MHMQLCLSTQRSVLGSSRSFKCGSPVVQQHKSCDFCCCHWATSLWKARPTRWLLCQLTEHHSWPHAAAQQNDVFPPHIRSHGPGPEEWYPSLRLGSSSLGISEGFPKRFSVSTRYMGQFLYWEREKSRRGCRSSLTEECLWAAADSYSWDEVELSASFWSYTPLPSTGPLSCHSFSPRWTTTNESDVAGTLLHKGRSYQSQGRTYIFRNEEL